MKAGWLAAALVGVALAATACSDGDDGGGGGALVGSFSIERSLAELPASAVDGGDDGVVQVFAGDLVAASEAAGIERPGSVDDVDEVIDWALRLTSGPPRDDEDPAPIFVPFPDVLDLTTIADIEEFDDEVRWSAVDVESFVELVALPARFSVLTGDFDEDRLLDAEVTDLGGGILTAGEGDDLETNPEDRTAVDRLGRPLRMALDGSQLAASLATAPLEEWVDGTDDTFAEEDGFVEVAAALDDAGAIAAVLTRADFGGPAVGGRDVPSEVLDRLRDDAIPVPFDTVGIGWSVDGDDAVITVVYHFDDADDAEEASEAVEAVYEDGTSFVTQQPIAELLVIDEVATDGANVIATLHLPPDRPQPIAAFQLLTQRDLPFIHA